MQLVVRPFTEVHVSGVSAVRFSNTLRKTRFRFRDGDEVDMVRHQAPGEVANSESLALLTELTEILFPILLREEHIHSANATLDDVICDSRDDSIRGVALQLPSYSCKE